MAKLVVCYIEQDQDFWLNLSLRSVLPFADKVVIVDGGSKDDTISMIDSFNDDRITVLSQRYRKEYKGADGFQRNKYLDYVKEHHEGWWCLVVDSDEIAQFSIDPVEFKQGLETAPFVAAGVHMRHYVYNFGLEDATLERHYAPWRLFKITSNLRYPEVEHVSLQGIEGAVGNCDALTLHHYGYAKGMKDLLKKFINHKAKSNVHGPEFLQQWYFGHLLGSYPVKRVDAITSHPDVIREVFGI